MAGSARTEPGSPLVASAPKKQTNDVICRLCNNITQHYSIIVFYTTVLQFWQKKTFGLNHPKISSSDIDCAQISEHDVINYHRRTQ